MSAVALRLAATGRVRTFVTWALIALLATSCGDNCKGGSTPSDVAQIFVVPGDLTVRQTETFSVRARLVNTAHEIIPDGAVPAISWTHGPFLSCYACTGPVASFKAGAPGETHIEVSTGSGSAARKHKVRVTIAGNDSHTSDWLRSPHSGSDFPVAVLASGTHEGTPVRDRIVNVAGEGSLGQFVCDGDPGCGELTVFAPHVRLTREKIAWTDGNDLMDKTGWASARAVPVSRVYVRTGTDNATKAEIEAAVLDDMALARKALADSWTGLGLVTEIDWGQPVVVVLGADHSCSGVGAYPSVRKQLVDVGVPHDEFGPDRIVAVYVKSLMKTTSGGPPQPMGGTSGLYCKWNPGDGAIVLLSWAERVTPTTFGHELMHGVGLGHPPDTEPFYKRSNLMYSGSTTTGSRRTYLSLGQAFRMNLTDQSIFNRSTSSSSLTCGSDASDTPCPPLARDLVKP